jgi:predicted TIM-barrel fold metal-dependent hydrolase
MKSLSKTVFVIALLQIFFSTSSYGESGESVIDNEKIKGYVEIQQHLWTSSGPTGAPGMRNSGSMKDPPFRFLRKRHQSTHARGKKGLKTKEDRINEYREAAANLIKTMDRYGVERALLTPPPRTKENILSGELDILFAVAAFYPNRFFVVGGGDELNSIIQEYRPSQVTDSIENDFREKAEQLAGRGVKAFGEMAALHLSFSDKHVFEESPADHPLFLTLADVAAEQGIPINLHMQAVAEKMNMPDGFNSNNPATLQENISGLERLLKHNPGTKIVWLHGGWDQTGDKSVDLIRRLFKKHPNLFISLRIEKRGKAMDGTPLSNRVVDKNFQVKEEWLGLFTEFSDRFMIGSDEFFAPATSSRRAPQSFEETWRIIDQLPNSLAQNIARNNAVRIYDL